MENGGRILVVDDDALFSEATTLTLRNAGYEAQACASIAEASTRLSKGDIDVLIADLQIPGNAGLEWLVKLASDRPQLAMLLCTGYPTLETAITAVGLPIAAYLVKPIAEADLLESVRAALPRSSAAPRPAQALRQLLEAERERCGLTARQVQVLEHIAQGLSNKEIAATLGCAVRTVELHVSELLRRTETESRTGLIARLWSGVDGGKGDDEAGGS